VTITCECGQTVSAEEATADLTPGIRLCPACAIDSTVPCHICGNYAPVRLYGTDGQEPVGPLGVGPYIATCRDCDTEEDQ